MIASKDSTLAGYGGDDLLPFTGGDVSFVLVVGVALVIIGLLLHALVRK